MELRYGKRFENKTFQFLFPALCDGLGKVFSLKIKNLSIMACGLTDRAIEENPKYQFLKQKRTYFILFDTFVNKKVCQDFLYWVKYQEYYLGSYHVDLTSRSCMVIFEFPEKYGKAYDSFTLGKYSEMFTEKEVKTLFVTGTHPYLVLLKHSSLIPDFSKRLQNLLALDSLEEIELEKLELEFPINIELEKEIFNG